MDEDNKAEAAADTTAAPKSEARKRTPPTIELTASAVSESVPPGSEPNAASPEPEEASPAFNGKPNPALPIVVSAVSGALAAVVVLGAGAWLMGWPAATTVSRNTAATVATVKGDVGALDARLAKIESDVAKPAPAVRPVTDPAIVTRIDALEKSVAALRDDVAAVRGQSDKAVAALSEIKSSPPSDGAPVTDMSAFEERLGKIERSTMALSAAAAAVPAPQPPVEDPRLRRIAVATLLDSSVRQGEPYASALAAARATTDDAGVLKPLDEFAAAGLPAAHALSLELLALLPTLAAKEDAPAAPSGIVERLQQSALKLVRIQRTDGAGSSNAAIITRVKTAAQRDDVNEAKRELNALPAQDRAPAQAWIAKADAREAALAASRQFASETMTTLAKPVR